MSGKSQGILRWMISGNPDEDRTKIDFVGDAINTTPTSRISAFRSLFYL